MMRMVVLVVSWMTKLYQVRWHNYVLEILESADFRRANVKEMLLLS